MKITTISQFEKFLKSRIPTREELFCGDIGVRRAKYFMRQLGNPQNKLKVIHIAGTSGKGSTAYLLSHMLSKQGFSVGISISPHVSDIRERMQINNALPDEKMLISCFNEILPVIKKMETSKYGSPTFFEINVGLAYYMFAKKKLDYAVMETGLGGRLDATNTVTSKNKLCLITKIGLDHTEILGKTISAIAGEKAGIINNQNMVLSINQTKSAAQVIKEKCAKKNATLRIISEKNFFVLSSSESETVFNFNFNGFKLQNIKLGIIGKHQAENCSLALCALKILAERDHFNINEKLLRNALRNITISGRMEIKKLKHKTIIIDGAHNPQKMQVLLKSLLMIFPKQKFTFILAFKKSKDYKKILGKIIPFAETIYLTHFSTRNINNHWSNVPQEEIANYLSAKGFNQFKIIDNKKADFLDVIIKSKKPIVITGSLYLIGCTYEIFNS